MYKHDKYNNNMIHRAFQYINGPSKSLTTQRPLCPRTVTDFGGPLIYCNARQNYVIVSTWILWICPCSAAAVVIKNLSRDCRLQFCADFYETCRSYGWACELACATQSGSFTKLAANDGRLMGKICPIYLIDEYLGNGKR